MIQLQRSRPRARAPALLALLLLLAPGLLGVERPKGLGDVVDVRTWSYSDYTRVVVEFDRSVELESEELVQLAADNKAGRPERLYLDLPGIWVGRRYVDGIEVGDGLLRAVRLGQNTLRTSRMVIDLERYQSHRMFSLRSPDRVVIDVHGSRRQEAEHARPRRGETDTAQTLRLSMESRPLHTVVIDAGHGGKDPGAIGVGGVREKDVNLKLAKLLSRRLRARSFRVVMTREDDRFIDLEERTVIAESSRGDVFVSLHANASRRKQLRGIEIYYLDEGHERHNLELAARENGVRPAELDTLQRTLSRLRVSEASVHSKALARQVHQDLRQGLAESAYRGVPDLGVKRGPFYVLFMSSMPSILVEAGFLTHRQEAALLTNDRYLDTVAAQIASGLGHYRNSSRQLTAELRAAERSSELPAVGAR